MDGHIAASESDKVSRVQSRSTGSTSGGESPMCILCRGPLADHETGDHAAKVVERMSQIGFPTPVSNLSP